MGGPSLPHNQMVLAQVAVGSWSPLAVGAGWWLAVGGPLGRSLTKKKNPVP